VPYRIDERQVVRAVLVATIHGIVRIDRRVPPVGGDLVVEILRRARPVPLADDDVSFDALRPGRRWRYFTRFPRSTTATGVTSRKRKDA
jgi:hypothetical protein